MLFLLFFQNLVRRYFRHCYKISVNEDSVIFIQVLFLIIFVQSGRRYYYLGVTIIRYLRVMDMRPSSKTSQGKVKVSSFSQVYSGVKVLTFIHFSDLN